MTDPVPAIAVQAGLAPGFVYTQLDDDDGRPDLLLAGRVDLDLDEAVGLLRELMNLSFHDGVASGRVTVGQSVGYVLREIHPTWADRMLLAVSQPRRRQALQVVRETGELLTVPRCDLPFPDQATSAWYYVSDSEWDLGIPAPSWMACSTGVLHGQSARYITRWDEDYWEILEKSAADMTETEAHIAPLACALDLGLDLRELAAMPVQ